tara:strand:- start:273 stop:716 length:444 start_codon:yes stop_codon:yes gene_type:complete
MRTSFLLAIIILAVLVSKSWACHEEDTNLDGHKPKTGVGIIVSTEIIVAFSSTTTSCDMYTAYLKSNYEQIAENAAVGGGLHLEGLFAYRGCSRDSLIRLQRAFKVKFESMFPQSDPLGEKFFQRFEELIINENLANKCPPPGESVS